MNKADVMYSLKKGVDDVVSLGQSVPMEAFYFKPSAEVWSAAENVQHLIQSVQPLNRLLPRPKTYFADKWGYANHTSRSYDEIVNSYHNTLGSGTTAPGAFVPLEINHDFVLLRDEFLRVHNALIEIIAQWEENDLDKYIIPHPAMGPLTIREMLLFTVYHIGHHRKIMEVRAALLTN